MWKDIGMAVAITAGAILVSVGFHVLFYWWREAAREWLGVERGNLLVTFAVFLLMVLCYYVASG